MLDEPATPIPRLTSGVFGDLAIWMTGMGLAIGLVFPSVIIPLGVPAEISLRPGFYGATIVAGLLVGGASQRVARLVVGRRLHQLSERMSHVSRIIEQAAYTGDWAQCTPEDCSLRIDSGDELGDVARSFNLLLEALASSRAVEDTLSGHTRELSGHLDLVALGAATVDSLVERLGAAAGTLCVVDDGVLATVASRRIDGEQVARSSAALDALDSDRIVVADVPADVVVDAAAVSFRPSTVVVAPLGFMETTLGVVVLAFDRPPEPEALRLLDSLRRPTAVALDNALTHDRFQRLAAIDPLTGAYNRRFGLGRLREEFARSVRASSPLGMLAFDLDHFKQVNDTHGHLAGDRVLRDVATAARNGLREGDVLIRSGGEEFLVVLPGASTEDVRAVAERIRRTIAGLVVTAGEVTLSVTASFGGVSSPDVDVAIPDDLVDRADRAMYRSKRLGRDRVTVVAPGRAGSVAS